jgi:hypothetical protein
MIETPTQPEQEKWLDALCNGNAEAVAFCRRFWSFCHLLDDIVDRDTPVNDDKLITEMASMVVELLHNPFVIRNKDALTALVLVSFNAWIDSNVLAMDQRKERRIASDVLKGFYHEVFYFVGYLCGGWAHYRKVSSQRNYSFDHCESKD